MSRQIYDNWGRLVWATMSREQLRQLCYASSMSSASSIHGGSFSLDHAWSRSSSKLPSSHIDAAGYEPGKLLTWYKEERRDGSTILVRRQRGQTILSEPLPAPYFSYDPDEKLIVFTGGSNKIGAAGNEMNWECRLNIATVIANAIALAHAKKPGFTDDRVVTFTDHLVSAMGYITPAPCLAISTMEYRSPEAAQYGGVVSWASDVYTYGALLTELLTSPSLLRRRAGDGETLAKWVKSRFREEGTLIVFRFIPVNGSGELIEMWKVLLVAMRCLDEDPNMRPVISNVVKMVEGVRKSP